MVSVLPSWETTKREVAVTLPCLLYDTWTVRSSVRFNFASSGLLAQQIAAGAPTDVFAAADEASMQRLADAGELAAPAAVFATNQLTIVVPAGSPKRITGLADLGQTGLTLALAGPTVPAGKYAAEVFAKADLPMPAASQETDVRAVLAKVALDEADAGIVYVTDLHRAGNRVAAVPIADALNVRARYLIAPLREAADAARAQAFVAFVLSPTGQGILKELGFGAP
jgi:molybdate transport system substrate-binding protein